MHHGNAKMNITQKKEWQMGNEVGVPNASWVMSTHSPANLLTGCEIRAPIALLNVDLHSLEANNPVLKQVKIVFFYVL